MNFFRLGQSADIDIVFDGADARKQAEVKTEDGKKEKYLLYYDGETVSGRVNVTLKKPNSKLEHQGIRIDLIGQIELYYDRGNHHEFQSLVKELARPGDLIQNTNYPFEFANVEKPYEVYVGSNVRLRYFLRVTITRRITDIVREIDVAVHTLCSYPEMNSPIKMEVGIEDCLHIEFEYNKSKYHLKDVIVGKIYFLLVRIKIKHMEIAIIKRETTGSGPNTFTENETIAKYEIMDGAPVKGESIPIRVFLAGYDLTPTMRDINKKFSVRYFLNLVLMDTEDRRYFKQQEITLWRKADKGRKSTLNSSTNPHVPSHLVGSDGEMMSTADILAARGAPAIGAAAAAAASSGDGGGPKRQPLGGDGEDADVEYDDDDDAGNDDGGRRRTGFAGGVVMNDHDDGVEHGRSSSVGTAVASVEDGRVGGGGVVPTTMGLFKQENSPIQESRPLPTNTSSSSLADDDDAGFRTTVASSSSTVSSPSGDSSLFADVESLRGSGDGAPYTGASSEVGAAVADIHSPPPAPSQPAAAAAAAPASEAAGAPVAAETKPPIAVKPTTTSVTPAQPPAEDRPAATTATPTTTTTPTTLKTSPQPPTPRSTGGGDEEDDDDDDDDAAGDRTA